MAESAKWLVDPAHSSLDFSIKHMALAKVKGSFHTFEGSIEGDPKDLTSGKVRFSANIESIDTRNQERDHHLRTADFFDAEKYPKMTFESSQIERKEEGTYEVSGELAIHGFSRTEVFQVTYEGEAKDQDGKWRAGFSGAGAIDRRNYGIGWNQEMEAGRFMIGNTVNIYIEIEAVKTA